MYSLHCKDRIKGLSNGTWILWFVPTPDPQCSPKVCSKWFLLVYLQIAFDMEDKCAFHLVGLDYWSATTNIKEKLKMLAKVATWCIHLGSASFPVTLTCLIFQHYVSLIAHTRGADFLVSRISC